MSMNIARCIFTLLLISSSLNAWSGNRVALVIGNSSYEELGKLANPAQDAEAI